MRFSIGCYKNTIVAYVGQHFNDLLHLCMYIMKQILEY